MPTPSEAALALAISVLMGCGSESPAVPRAPKVDPPSSSPAKDWYGVGMGNVTPTVAQARVALRAAAGAGVKWLRYTVNWRGVERQQGVYNWSVPDSIIQIASENGIKVLAVVTATPIWIADAPDSLLTDDVPACAAIPYRRYPPKDFEIWSDFMTKASARYKGRVAAWEIWNEPDLDRLKIGSPCGARYWCGTSGQFARLVVAAAEGVRKGDVTAPVVMGGLALATPGDLQFLREVAQNQRYPALRRVDALAFHFYKDSSDAALAVADVRAVLSESGLPSIPIWVTETGRSSSDSEENQKAYLQSVLPAFKRSGIERSFWWRLLDELPTGRCPVSLPGFGLLTSELQPKLSLKAFAELSANGRSP